MQTGSAGDFSCSSEQVAFLVSTHLQFCNISRQSINSFLDSSSTDSDRTQTLDPRLPFIVEAIVLLSQCLITALLKEADGPGYESVKRVIITLENNDFIDILIDVLRLLDRFLPRINQGQPQFTTTQAQRPRLESDSTGFAYAKRDLVRLLGILSHEDRVVQDQIRKSGGIPVVMSLCVIDERNPYLREHALFALRNIIHRNDKNKKEVAEIRPLKDWDVEGVLQDLRT
ncbi:hypothetical protein FRC02_003275 [Tulasnella sp. 418]|nr:hypothetical protein FRC02_003275 [Tulasnella sp. 418]